MARLTLTFFGTFQVALDSQPITRFRSSKNAGLLVYLALQSDRPFPREVLATLFWPEESDNDARNNLRQAAYQLRKVLGDLENPDAPYLLATRQSVQFNADSEFTLDVNHFWQSIDRGDLEAAVAIYHGDLLPGFTCDSLPFEDWLRQEREQLHQAALEAMSEVTQVHLQAGMPDKAQALARQQLALEPWRESACRQLMQAYALTGDRSNALAQYEQCREILWDELGVEPAAATVQLYERIKVGTFDETPQDLKPREVLPDPAAIPLHNLPPQPTPFVGRTDELAALDKLLTDPTVRLVTIMGPGGMGKTRLALTCSERQVEAGRFVDGVYFVPLAAISDVAHIVPAVASALSVTLDGEGDPKSQLLKVLQSQQMLLVLDNFEHLLDGVELMAEILQTGPDVKILATSRERLLLHGEQVYPIQGLVYPDEGKVPGNIADYSAVQLFLQSACRVQPSFALDEEEHRPLTHICHLVAGMPLGIELAAAWVEFLSLAEIESEIQRNLDFLETEIRDLPERHRSMRAVFEGSWHRMSQEEQAIFIRLSVFRGGFTRNAAEEVASATFRQLGGLVFKSLLQYDQEQKRHHLHELLRQYGAEKLAEDEVMETAVRNQHSDYYCTFLQQQEYPLKSAGVLRALKEIGEEIDNVRKAWEWSATHLKVKNLAKATTTLGWFYYWPGRHLEGEAAFRFAGERVEAGIAGSNQATSQKLRLWSTLLAWQSRFANELEKYAEARTNCQKALDLLDRPDLAGEDTRRERAFVFEVFGYLQIRRLLPDIPPDVDYNAESLVLYRDLGDQWGMAFVLARLGEKANYDGDHEAAEAFNREAWGLAEALNHPLQKAWPLMQLGLAVFHQGRSEEGLYWVKQAIEISEDNNYKPGRYAAKIHASNIAITLGQFSQAHTYLTDSTTLGSRLGTLSIRWAYSVFARASLHLGHYEEAEAHAQKAFALSKDHHGVWLKYSCLFVLARAKMAQGHDREAQRLFQECDQYLREFNLSGMLAELLATKTFFTHQQASRILAEQSLQEAFTLALQEKIPTSIMYAMAAAAFFFAQKGLGEQAVEHYALASGQPFVGNSRWFEDVVGRPIAEMTADLSPAVVAAAKERGRKRDLRETVESLLEELSRPDRLGNGQF